MATEWVKDSATFKPSEFEFGGKNIWVQRKNITEVHSTDPDTGETRTEYESDLRFITDDEYNREMSKKLQETNANTNKTVSDETIIKEAIADLYEMLLEI